MRIVLATGIYPPMIGGPATYVERLAEGLVKHDMEVTVITYSDIASEALDPRGWRVVRVAKRGVGLRWMRYARALRKFGKEADIVYCFSSVSCGIPMFLSHLRRPKRVLRLGGDFLWERYTDRGGILGLAEWYKRGPWLRNAMNGLLRVFQYIVYSTEFQQSIHERAYGALPMHSVIENAVPAGNPIPHSIHEPVRLLSLGRFVPFKNISSLIAAMAEIPNATLTIAGEGPLEETLKKQVAALPVEVGGRISFLPPQRGPEKITVFAEHDLLVIPSFTDISPNAALEARAAGLPVLITEHTGLSTLLADGCLLRELKTSHQIAHAVRDAITIYPQLAMRASAPLPERGWNKIADEHVALFRGML